ncbi:hypothetical protein CLPUN_23810 [Clostridium puniceum]|uniref:PA14 domain-containing protein n=1 Tax=Clostridium puniceum TaxID=29367 RepID=A0A1S8TI33_9CLOT|nr:hypothetical protein [Clostridium puniceum]OOM77264.1 hypothetical protein CLPUN_23810 [Clostridium puniceum]
MKIVFEKIFRELNEECEQNLIEKGLVTMSKNNIDNNRNSLVFDFIFDDNGDYSYTGSEHGFGKSVNISGKIIVPEDGIYSVKIKSSDGGGGQWDSIKANEEVSCIINTSFWHQTTIKIYIHSNKPNSKGHAVIEYSI